MRLIDTLSGLTYDQVEAIADFRAKVKDFRPVNAASARARALLADGDSKWVTLVSDAHNAANRAINGMGKVDIEERQRVVVSAEDAAVALLARERLQDAEYGLLVAPLLAAGVELGESAQEVA